MSSDLPNWEGCGQCGKTENLMRCSGCKVMLYCGREHQAAHRNKHKSACKDVVKARNRCQLEEEKIRNTPNDDLSWGNAFETGPGRFWGILETRDYMRARFTLAEAVGIVGTKQGLQEKLDHYMDMLRLCRGDNMGIRSFVPAIMLRLNMDQESYDFMKWWLIERDDYDWGDMSQPYLDIKNADVFEEMSFLQDPKSFPGLDHLVGLTLLKVKLLLDLKELEKLTAYAGSKVPREILDEIRLQAPVSPIIANNQQLRQRDDHSATIKLLDRHIRELYKTALKRNKFIWEALVTAIDGSHPGMYTIGSKEEAQYSLFNSLEAWWETKGAMDYIEGVHNELAK
ncbi:zinc finger MYND domain-containing protein [Aspergillus mulundensis]|uniref:MYND-type domain-containing protein n=1 Tax=Aspergillus mulundensis TaxID=1810919 RepID=A0A3D8Q5G7_9EURO|nr:hypothetical protein DSM5745_11576 [Aspergillus mulundensis]RDW57053.1 hypothetical protein DSM5745_11576 [Aspergillus mulundensis]